MQWVVGALNKKVQAELDSLPEDIQARFRWIAEAIQTLGLHNMRETHIKHLEGPLWEMRLKGRDGIARAIYVTATGHRIVVLRAFVKKTRETPRAEIEIAYERAKEIGK